MISRRRFLRTAASASLATATAGGALALQVQEVTRKSLAEDRAKRAWSEFCDAMRDLAGDADGWTILGAGERWTKQHPSEKSEPFLNVRAVHYVKEPFSPGSARMITVERHRYIVPLTDPRQLEIAP